MIYNDAWSGVCALYDAVYGPYKEESEETLDSDGELCDDEEEEGTGWNE